MIVVSSIKFLNCSFKFGWILASNPGNVFCFHAMAQYNIDNVTVSAEFFGHVLLQWASILSLLFLFSQNINGFNILTKLWAFYMGSQVCVCTSAYLRLEFAKLYEGDIEEQIIWYTWRVFVSFLVLSTLSMAIVFTYIDDDKHKIFTFLRKILPIWSIIYFVILFGIRLISPILTDLWLFLNAIIIIIWFTITYVKFVNRSIKNGSLNDRHSIGINKINIILTIINTISFVGFNLWYVYQGNGWIGIAQRLIGGIWYFYNTYSYIHLTKMNCFKDLKTLSVANDIINSNHNKNNNNNENSGNNGNNNDIL